MRAWLRRERRAGAGARAPIADLARPALAAAVVEGVESRILWSADLPLTTLPLAAQPYADAPLALVQETALAGVFDAPAALAQAAQSAADEWVFIASDLPDLDVWLEDFSAQQAEGRSLRVALIDAATDGLLQIAQAWDLAYGPAQAAGRPIVAVHVVTHGSTEGLQLGASWLDAEPDTSTREALAAWRDRLSDTADVLIYGCNLAAGPTGQGLLRAWSELTGADVAGSDDLTGQFDAQPSAADWTLEWRSGLIDHEVAASPTLQAVWRGTLATFTVTSTNPSGPGSLSDAVNQANMTSGPDRIHFAIPGTGPQVIAIPGAIPIVESLVIDGRTQAPGSSTPAIILDGSASSNVPAIMARVGTITIQGLAIINFDEAAIDVESNNFHLQSSWLGVDPRTGLAAGNGGPGLSLNMSGWARVESNLISANGGAGVDITSGTYLAIAGNQIGVGPDGETAMGNGGDGVSIRGNAFFSGAIGGTEPWERNVIANHLTPGSSAIEISADNAAIAILGNRLYNNAAVGIDLLGNGGPAPANDPLDADIGSNGLLNAPVLTSATYNDSVVDVRGQVSGLPETDMLVELFVSPASMQQAQAWTRLGSVMIRTDGGGQATWQTQQLAPLNPGDRITATATQAERQSTIWNYNRTSPLSAPILVDVPNSGNRLVVNALLDVQDGDASSVSALLANPGADGRISLREALVATNNTPGLDEVQFNLPGNPVDGAYTIRPGSMLPRITSPLRLDARNQPNPEGLEHPLVLLDGSLAGAGADGLQFGNGSDGSTLQGLVIGNFSGHGVLIEAGADGVTLQGNHIGLDATGSAILANGGAGVRVLGNSALIGGTTESARNVISGNQIGVLITGHDNRVQGNYIGLDRTGLSGLGNSLSGVSVRAGGQRNTIGGDVGGAGNIISNNGEDGVVLADAGTVGNFVQGNLIGVDISGAGPMPNRLVGVAVALGAMGNVIGGAGIASNVISGNGQFGVRIVDAGTDGNLVINNLIGLAASGREVLANTVDQIRLETSGPMQANQIGGIGQGNFLAGDRGAAIRLVGQVNGTIIEGNRIGVGTDLIPLGELVAGIVLGTGSLDTVIGGVSSGQGNLITEVDKGVVVSNGSSRNLIRANQMYGIDELAIDLLDDGPTTNDRVDQDTGANTMINFPVLVSAEQGLGGLVLQGMVFGAPSGVLTLDFYADSQADGGRGQGQIYLGSSTVTVGANGQANWTALVNAVVPEGQWVTATASAPSMGTSEFSAPVVVIDTANAPAVISLPETQFVGVDTTLGFRADTGNRIRIQDADSLGGDLVLTLRADQGSLSVFPAIRDQQAQVGTVLSDDVLEPLMAIAPDGSTALVWMDTPPNAASNIYMQRLGADGQALFEPVIVNSDINGNKSDPAMAMAADGSFVAVWVSERQEADGGNGIYGQRFAADGRPIGTEFHINTSVVGHQYDPAIAMRPSGGFVVVWGGERDGDGDGDDISLQEFDASGQPIGTQIAVNTASEGMQSSPRVSINPTTGAVAVVWRSLLDGDANDQIMLRVFDGTMQVQSPEVWVSDGVGTTMDSMPEVLFHRTDGVVVTWTGAGQTRFVMRGWRMDGSLTPPTEIDVGGRVNPYRLLMTSSSTVTGAVELVWRNDTSSDSSLVREVRSFDGAELLDKTILAHTNSSSEWFGVAPDPDGGLRFVMDAGNTIGGVMFDVFRVLNPVWSQGSGNGDAVLQLRGSASYLQAVLDNLDFTPTPGFIGQASLTVEVDDLGNTGSGGALTSSRTLLLNVFDNTPGVTIRQLSSQTTEAGGTASFAMRLNTPPTANVFFNFDVVGPEEGVLSVTALTFTPSNWSQIQTVTVTGRDDLVMDGLTSYQIEFTPGLSTDPTYQGMTVGALTMTNVDNDVSHAVTVTTSNDVVDGDTSSLVALVHAPGADRAISLREAMLAANQTPSTEAGINRIVFDLGDGEALESPVSINITTSLPDITRSVIIDGTSQLGWVRAPLVQIDGRSIDAANPIRDLIRIAEGDVVLRGLLLTGAPGYGLRALPNVDSGILESSWVGLRNDVAAALVSNTQGGVLIEGGRWTLRENLISNNGGHGVEVRSDDLLMVGNEVGLDTSGAYQSSNDGHGVLVSGHRAVIGQVGATSRNWLTGNAGFGLVITGDDARIVNNAIGVDRTDNDYWVNSAGGVALLGKEAWLGGLTAEEANVFAGNNAAAIRVEGVRNRVTGNQLGFVSSLTSYVWPGGAGIEVAGEDAIIGGTEAGAGNVLGRFDSFGIHVLATSTGAVVQGNWIGVTPAGVAIGGTMVGILVEPLADGVLIGGEPIARTGLPPANVIMNTGLAVQVGDQAQNVAILGNRMFNNGGLSIDLGQDSRVTDNDAGDVDDGSNRLVNFPELTGVTVRSGVLSLSGVLRSEPNTAFRIEFYSVSAARASTLGHGEADRWLGAITVSTDASGVAVIDHPLPAGATEVGDHVSATATIVLGAGRFGPTSEMAVNRVTEQGFLAPELISALLQQLPEYDRAGLVLSGRSVDFPDVPITYTLLPSADSSWFVLDASTGLLRFASPPDFEAPRDADMDNRYELIIGVSDGRATTRVPMSVTVLNGADPRLAVTAQSASEASERGGQILVQISLSGVPTTEVTVEAALSDASRASLGQSRLIFTPGALQQTLVINSLDNTLADGDGLVMLRFSPSSSDDVFFTGLAIDTLALRIRDDDARNIVRVTTLDDRLDGNVQSLQSLVANPGADGLISLREALLAANATPNPASAADPAALAQVSDAIYIDVMVDPASAERDGNLERMQRIVLNSPLPAITDAVLIDGWNRFAFTPSAGMAERPELIYTMLDGFGLPTSENPGAGVDGLVVQAAGTQLSHLRLNNFSGAGVRVRDAAGVVIDRVVFRQLAEGVVGEGDASRFVVEQVDFGALQGLPIRLGGNALQTQLPVNDVGDADLGPNGLQNAPVLVRAPVFDANGVELSGSLTGLPRTTYVVDIYAASAQRLWGEGQRLLAQTRVTTDAQGDVAWQVSLPGLVSGQALTALARSAEADLWQVQVSPFAPVVWANRPTQLTLNAGRFDYVENAGVQGLVPDAQVQDDDSPDYSGGRLTVVLRDAVRGDEGLSLANQGLNADMIGWSLVAGLQTVTYAGVPIGTMTTFIDAQPYDHQGVTVQRGAQRLEFAFNQSATVASVQALIRAIQYQNSSDDPVGGDRALQWELDDGDSAPTLISGTTAGLVRVLPVNDQPQISGPLEISLPEQSAAWSARILATDVDSRDALRYRLLDDFGGALAINPATGVVQVLRSQALDFETQSAGRIEVEVTDAAGAVATETYAVRILDVNESPQWSLPAPPTLTAGQDMRFVGTARINLRDPDLDTRKLEVQITVSQGQLTLDAVRRAELVNALGAGAVTGTGSVQDPLRLFGSVEQLQTALDALIFQVAGGYAGDVSLELLTLDRGAWTWDRAEQLAEVLQAAPTPQYRVAQKLALQVQQGAPISNPLTPITPISPGGTDSVTSPGGTGGGTTGSGTGSTNTNTVLDTGTLVTQSSGTGSEGVKAATSINTQSQESSSVVQQIQQRITSPSTSSGGTSPTSSSTTGSASGSGSSSASRSGASSTNPSSPQVVASAGANLGLVAAASGGIGAGMLSGASLASMDEPGADHTDMARVMISSTLGVVRDFSLVATSSNLSGRSVELAARTDPMTGAATSLIGQMLSGLDSFSGASTSQFRSDSGASASRGSKAEVEVQVDGPTSRAEEQTGTEGRRTLLDIEATEASTVALSFGAVWWALKSGGLVSAFLAGVPALRGFDLVPMLIQDGGMDALTPQQQADRARQLRKAIDREDEEEAVDGLFAGR